MEQPRGREGGGRAVSKQHNPAERDGEGRGEEGVQDGVAWRGVEGAHEDVLPYGVMLLKLLSSGPWGTRSKQTNGSIWLRLEVALAGIPEGTPRTRMTQPFTFAGPAVRLWGCLMSSLWLVGFFFKCATRGPPPRAAGGMYETACLRVETEGSETSYLIPHTPSHYPRFPEEDTERAIPAYFYGYLYHLPWAPRFPHALPKCQGKINA